MRFLYKQTLFLIGLLMPFCTWQAQTTLYTENFNGGTHTWSLNTLDAGSVATPAANQFSYWIVNNSYTGGPGNAGLCLGVLPMSYTFVNTPTQAAGITGSPTSNYLHLTSPGGTMNAGYLGVDGICVSAAKYFSKMTSDISTVGFSEVSIKFWWIGTGADQSKLELFYSTNGGSVWTMVTTPVVDFAQNSTWLQHTASIPEFGNQATIRFGFRLRNDPYTVIYPGGIGYGIDDIEVIGDNGMVIPNEIATGTINPLSYCPQETVSVPYTVLGNYTAGNVFTAQLSNASGSFASPVNIGTLSSTTSGTIVGTIPGGTAVGTGYRIRVVSSTPATTGTANASNISVSETLTWYADTDNDGHGDADNSIQGCAQPTGYVDSSDDCDDDDQLIWLAKPAEIVLNLNPNEACITDLPFPLGPADPIGGTWSGPGISNGIFTPATAGVGEHTLTYSVLGDGECVLPAASSFSFPVLAEVDCASIGIDNTEENAIAVYPTQTNGVLNIRGKGINSVVMMDMSGKEIGTFVLNSANTIDVTHVASGFYMVKVNTASGTQVFRISKVN